jgi:hypothetical protein
MKVQFLLFLVLASISFSASARKPAVEDFVGVVPETYKVTPKGTEVIFDFGNKIENIQKTKQSQLETSSWSAIIGLSFFLLLPFLTWTFITRFKTQGTTNTHSPTMDEQPNLVRKDDSRITHLDDYRKNELQKTDDDKDKKAS